MGRVTNIKENGTTSLAAYTYDLQSKRTGTTLGNGKTVGYDYFLDGAMKQFTQSGIAVGSSALTDDFTYTAAHQMENRTVSDNAFIWLPPEDGTEDYNDANGLDQYECIDGDPLISCSDGKVLSYEGNGNLLTYEGWTYTYSVKNQLLSAAKSGQATVTFTYDSLGRRSSKTIDDGVTTSTITFLSDGVEEIADYDGANLKYRYVNGVGVDERLAYYEYNASGSQINKEYYHVDWQGSVIATSDTTGNRVELQSYNAFGVPSDGTGQPFKYTGRRWDDEVGLYYYRARYYHPTLGRFLQTDPVGYADNMNMYAYVGNDPINSRDPSGMVAAAGTTVSKRCSRCDPNMHTVKGAGQSSHAASANNNKVTATQSTQGKLPEVPGYPETGSNSWRGDHDQLFIDAVADYNTLHGFNSGDKGFWDPMLLKSQAMIESGGDKKAFLSDPMQVNVPDDHVARKVSKAGLTKNQKMTPKTSIEGSLKWLHYKNAIHDSTGAITGYRGQRDAIRRYNGNNSPHSSYPKMRHKDWYTKVVVGNYIRMTISP